LLFTPAVEEYYLVHWEDEGSVTAVPATSVDKGVVGERKATFEGKLILLLLLLLIALQYNRISKELETMS